mmetsp:Transcript_18231/g.18296  ORF Transcript_18231/g.18296 Transcript_18231/m.18296 type:complete len:215 (+) Transcript_18231:39-683(+)
MILKVVLLLIFIVVVESFRPIFFNGLSALLKRSPKSQEASTSIIKSTIIEKAQGTSNGVKASSEIKKEILELTKQLEKVNSIPNIAADPRNDGLWELVYTSSNSSSAGKLGPFVGYVTQSIDLKSKLYLNKVDLFNGLVVADLQATWNVESSKKWIVKFLKIQFYLAGVKVLSKPFSANGTWRFTYIDDDLRVLYTLGGRNNVSENLFILKKLK